MWREYIQLVTYYAIDASVELSKEYCPFAGFAGSDWANGKAIDRMIKDNAKHGFTKVGRGDWEELRGRVAQHGMFNQHLQAVPPTGSISYINGSTSSIHPIVSKIEIRKEGKIGRVYYPAYGLTNDNIEQVKTAYEIGPNPIIDMYAASTPYIDQGQSLTLFFKDSATTRDINRSQRYAHKNGIKTMYYLRIQKEALPGTEVEGCVSCML
jgi:ribonucleoside-diphosphate reductase alpha chain